MAVLLGSAASVLLKRLGLFYAAAEGIGFLLAALVAWPWARQQAVERGTEARFWVWIAWWIGGAIVGIAIRVSL